MDKGSREIIRKVMWSNVLKTRYKNIFTMEDIRYLIKKKVISKDLQDSDLEFLDRLAKVWRDIQFFRRGLIKFTYKDRLKAIEVANYKTKIDRFLFERIKNEYLKNGKISYNEILIELSGLFKITLTEERKRFFREKIRLIYLDVINKLKKTGLEKKISIHADNNK